MREYLRIGLWRTLKDLMAQCIVLGLIGASALILAYLYGVLLKEIGFM